MNIINIHLPNYTSEACVTELIAFQFQDGPMAEAFDKSHYHTIYK